MNRPSWDRQRINDRGRATASRSRPSARSFPNSRPFKAAVRRPGDTGLLDSDAVVRLVDTCGFSPEEAQRAGLGDSRPRRRAAEHRPPGLGGAPPRPINQPHAEEEIMKMRRSHCRRRTKRIVSCHHVATISAYRCASSIERHSQAPYRRRWRGGAAASRRCRGCRSSTSSSPPAKNDCGRFRSAMALVRWRCWR